MADNKSSLSLSPDARLLAALRNLILHTHNIQTFCFTTKSLLENGKHDLGQSLKKLTEEQMAEPEVQELFGGSSFLKNEAVTSLLFEAAVMRSIRISKQMVDSSAFVFAHAVLDEAFSESCFISFECSPADWYPLIDNRKVDLKTLEQHGLESIRREKAFEFVSQLSRESIIQRLDCLNQVCIPRLNGKKAATSILNREVLIEFDRTRHKIVHGDPFNQNLPEVQDSISLAGIMGFLPLGLVSQAYGLNAGGILKENADKLESFNSMFAGLSADFPEAHDLITSLLKKMTAAKA